MIKRTENFRGGDLTSEMGERRSPGSPNLTTGRMSRSMNECANTIQRIANTVLRDAIVASDCQSSAFVTQHENTADIVA